MVWLLLWLTPRLLFSLAALFSQFVDSNSQLWEKTLMALIAGTVDMLWYMLMAVVISHSTH